MNEPILLGTPSRSKLNLYSYIDELKSFTLTASDIFMYKQCIDYFLTKSNKSLTNKNPENLQIDLFCTQYRLSKILISLPEGIKCNTY